MSADTGVESTAFLVKSLIKINDDLHLAFPSIHPICMLKNDKTLFVKECNWNNQLIYYEITPNTTATTITTTTIASTNASMKSKVALKRQFKSPLLSAKKISPSTDESIGHEKFVTKPFSPRENLIIINKKIMDKKEELRKLNQIKNILLNKEKEKLIELVDKWTTACVQVMEDFQNEFSKRNNLSEESQKFKFRDLFKRNNVDPKRFKIEFSSSSSSSSSSAEEDG